MDEQQAKVTHAITEDVKHSLLTCVESGMKGHAAIHAVVAHTIGFCLEFRYCAMRRKHSYQELTPEEKQELATIIGAVVETHMNLLELHLQSLIPKSIIAELN